MSDEAIRQQYAAYPYPTRDPRDEAKRLIIGSPSDLDEIAHYLHAGRLDLSTPFHALVAGGGTGDAAIMLAQQLAERGSAHRVTYLDLSPTSRQIAEARAQARGLHNLHFLTGSLLEVASLAPGPFDYIDCCGVLHHLADPGAGLAALRAVLKPAGGLGLMLYGPLGRTGVYPLQKLLQEAVGALPLAEQVAYTRRLLPALPTSNWLRRNPFIGDYQGSDAGLVDLLLHSQDQPFTVGDIGVLLAEAGLTLASFVEPWRYEPAAYLTDALLLKPLNALPPLARAAAAERLAGNMKTHVFYAKVGAAPPLMPFAEAVPVLKKVAASDLAASVQATGRIKLEAQGLSFARALPRLAAAIIERVDGKRTLADIAKSLPVETAAFDKALAETLTVLSSLNVLLLGPLGR